MKTFVNILFLTLSLFLFQLTIPFQTVISITKERTALLIPNAMQIATTVEKVCTSATEEHDDKPLLALLYLLSLVHNNDAWPCVTLDAIGHTYM